MVAAAARGAGHRNPEYRRPEHPRKLSGLNTERFPLASAPSRSSNSFSYRFVPSLFRFSARAFTSLASINGGVFTFGADAALQAAGSEAVRAKRTVHSAFVCVM